MSSWNEFCDDARRFANKAVKKTEEVAHIASLRFKLEGTKNKISANFEKLGRLTYKQLKSGESQAEKISSVIEAIENLRKEEKEILAELNETEEEKE